MLRRAVPKVSIGRPKSGRPNTPKEIRAITAFKEFNMARIARAKAKGIKTGFVGSAAHLNKPTPAQIRAKYPNAKLYNPKKK